MRVPEEVLLTEPLERLDLGRAHAEHSRVVTDRVLAEEHVLPLPNQVAALEVELGGAQREAGMPRDAPGHGAVPGTRERLEGEQGRGPVAARRAQHQKRVLGPDRDRVVGGELDEAHPIRDRLARHRQRGAIVGQNVNDGGRGKDVDDAGHELRVAQRLAPSRVDADHDLARAWAAIGE
jgi:hypothetical protein